MGYMTKSRLAILIHKQTLNVSCAVEESLAPRTSVEEKIRSRLKLHPVPNCDGIEESLIPYVKAYWDVCYRFLQDERNLLEKVINDLYAEEGDRELKEALETIDYIDRRLEDMREAAVIVGLITEE